VAAHVHRQGGASSHRPTAFVALDCIVGVRLGRLQDVPSSITTYLCLSSDRGIGSSVRVIFSPHYQPVGMKSICTRSTIRERTLFCGGTKDTVPKVGGSTYHNMRTHPVRWSESVEELIRNTLAPVVVRRIALDTTAQRATVTIDSKRSDARAVDPSRLRLASKVVGWELHLVGT
jgi:hypothetical protein